MKKTKEQKRGLFNKYYLEKADGSAIDPNARYFILRYDKDLHARKALDAYANSVLSENPKFAMDLQRALFETAKK